LSSSSVGAGHTLVATASVNTVALTTATISAPPFLCGGLVTIHPKINPILETRHDERNAVQVLQELPEIRVVVALWMNLRQI